MYLYYPHAPILLRVVKHAKRTKQVLSQGGGYRWAAHGREGYLTNDEADKAIRLALLIVVTDEEASDLKARMPDLLAARLAASWNSSHQVD